MTLELEIPCEVRLNGAEGHKAVLKLDTEQHILSIEVKVEKLEQYGYVDTQYKKFRYRLVPVEAA